MAAKAKTFEANAPFLTRMGDGAEEYRDSGIYTVPDQIAAAEADRLVKAGIGTLADVATEEAAAPAPAEVKAGA